MRPGRLALFAVVAAAAAALLVWALWDPGAGPAVDATANVGTVAPESPDAAALHSATPPRRAAVAPADGSGRDTADAVPSDDDGGWSWRVEDPDGNPIAGARVVILDVAGSSLAAVTDADGRITFPVKSATQVVVLFRAEGYAAGVWSLATAEKTIRLARGATVTGRVLSEETSAPLEGAAVSARRWEPPEVTDPDALALLREGTRTAPDGWFELGDLPTTRAGYGLRVACAGHAPIVVRDVATLGEPPWELRLPAAGRVEGVVRDAEGRPAEGALVHVEMRLPNDRGRGAAADPDVVWTDANGRFVVDGLRFGWVYDLRARNAEGSEFGEVNDGVCVTAEFGVATVEVALRARAGLEVAVTDADGSPASAGEVVLVQSREIVARATLEDSGVARFVTAPPGEWSVGVLPDEGLVQLYPTRADDRARGSVRVQLTRGWTVAGVIVDDLGRPAEGVSVTYDRTPPLQGYEPGATQSAEDGTFVVHGFLPGNDGLALERESVRVAEVDVGGPSESLRLTAPRLATLRFHVAGRAEIWIGWDALDAEGGEIATDSDGWLGDAEIRVPPCARIVLRPEGFLRVERDVAAAPGAVVDLGELPLETGKRLRGRVVDPEGHPVASANIWVWNANSDLVGSVEAGADGEFEVESLPSGPLEVEGESPGFVRDQSVPAVAGSPEVLVVRLQRGGLVRGRAVDASGKDLPGVGLSLETDDDVAGRSEGGGPLVVRALAGTWRLRAWDDDGDEIGSATVEVREGGVHDVVVTVRR